MRHVVPVEVFTPRRSLNVPRILRAVSATVALGAGIAAPLAAQRPRRAPAPAPAATIPSAPVKLIPRPREITENGSISLRDGVAIEIPTDTTDRLAARELGDALTARGIRVKHVALASTAGRVGVVVVFDHIPSRSATQFLNARHIAFDTRDTTLSTEGYVLVSEPATTGSSLAPRLTVLAATATGIFYGAQTARQLFEGAGESATLHVVRIRDWPAMRWRGVQDDLSRGPVPTLDYQERQIRTFAAFKINAYSPYFENTLAYTSNPLMAPPGGAMTPQQVKELVAYAHQYHVEVIPEQEAFGHLHHVLKQEIYSSLGETPHGHVLAPNEPGAMALIQQMFAAIDTLFPGPFIHLGADETFELGRGKTAAEVKARGLGPVYLDFLKRIVDSIAPRDTRLATTGIGVTEVSTAQPRPTRRYLFWGDIAGSNPELVKTLPHSMIAVPWNYWLTTGFDSSITPFTRAGLETWVAPGVSNWGRVYPNNAIALPNIQGFVRAGQRLGATGMLNTSWNDDGESLFDEAWYGVLYGAAAGWEPAGGSTTDYAAAFGRVFHGDTTGLIDRAQQKLASAHAMLDHADVGDGSDELFWMDPYGGTGQATAKKIRPILHDLRVAAESALVFVAQARQAQLREPEALDALELGARRMDFIGMKFQFADEIQQMYAAAAAADTTEAGKAIVNRALDDLTSINGRLEDMRDGYSLLRDLYEQAWMRENRPYWLHNVLVRYDAATQLWVDRLDRVVEASEQYDRTGKLPPASAVGLGASP